MTILERIAAPFERIGIKPAVTLPLLTAIVLAVANWIATGEPFDVDELKAAFAAFLIAAAGVASPPAVGRRLDEVSTVYRR